MIGLQQNGSIATFAAFPKYLDHSNTAVSVAQADSSFATKRHYWHQGDGIGSLIVVEYDLSTGVGGQVANQDGTVTTSAQIVCVSGPTSGVMPTNTTSVKTYGPDGDYAILEYNGQNQQARFTDVISGDWLTTNGLSFTDSFSVALEIKLTSSDSEAQDKGASKSWFLWGL